MTTFWHNLARDEDGATAIEYGLIVALIAIAIIASIQGIGNELSTTFNLADSAMSKANAANV